MQFRKLATQFVVHDVVATAEYYQNVLGFELLSYFLDPPVYAMLSRGGVEMHFGKADGRPADSSSTEFRRVGFDAYIWVDDVFALFDELKAKGANITEGPVKRVYESTEIAIEDCNGLKIDFGD